MPRSGRSAIAPKIALDVSSAGEDSKHMQTISITDLMDLDRSAVQASRDALAGCTATDLDRPTPCAGWSLADLIAHFGVEGALAAYNAGEDRSKLWKSEKNYDDVAEFVESIPFTETRDYVQIVMRNAQIYRMLNPAQAVASAAPTAAQEKSSSTKTVAAKSKARGAS